MAEKNLHRQAQRGVRVMLGRQVFLQGLTLVFGVLLARILDPADFGLFGITTFVVGMLKLLGDCGIAPSLIQRSTEVTEGDLKTAFTLQQILVTGAFAALWFLAPLAPSVYPRGGEPLMWLIRVLGINLYLQSWRSIGVVVLERGMRYRAVAVVEIVESVSYQLIAVVLAYLGFGVWSLVAAVLVRSFLGAGMVVNLARFKPGFRLDGRIVRETLKFGLPFQGERIVRQARNWVTPTLVAAMIGPEAVGYLTWAMRLGTKPTFVLSSSVVRVSFAYFSRLQDKPEMLLRVLSTYIDRLLPFFVYWVVILLTASDLLIPLVYTEKWLPALPALLLYAGMSLLTVPGYLARSALNAAGQVGLTFRITLFRTVLQVALSVALVFMMGFNGVALAAVIAVATTVPAFLNALHPRLLRRLLRSSASYVVPVLLAIAVSYATRTLDLALPAQALLTILCTSTTFALSAWLLGPSWIRSAVRLGNMRLRKK